ncbi:FGGY family carbohydrate kinase [Thalassotalea litorea]|uniref:FGGY family carbohydrate kinase n=1 Tax=Thalassotalea litorea TaxID=2020715 RepID=UPI003736901B
MQQNPKRTTLVASIDLGSQSIRGYLYGLNGELAYRTHIDMDITCTSIYPWQSDPQQMVDVVKSLIDDLIGQTVEGHLQHCTIAAISLTCLRNSFVYLDKNKDAILPILYWYQGRRATQVPQLPWYWRIVFTALGQRGEIDKLQQQAAVNWVAEHHPEGLMKTHQVCQLSGYLQGKLTGNYTDSWANMIAHLPLSFKRRRWLKSWAWQWSALNVNASWLPKLCKPGTDLGDYTAIIHDTQICVPVVAGAADKTCELLGSGVIDESSLFVSLGTAITVNCLVVKCKGPKPFYPAYPTFNEDYYLAEEMLDYGCRLLREFVAWKCEHMIEDNELNADTLSEAHLQDWICAHLIDLDANDTLSNQISQVCSDLSIADPIDLNQCRIGDIFRWDSQGCPENKDPEPMRQIGIEYLALLHWLALKIRDAKLRMEARHKRRFTRMIVSGGGQQSTVLLYLLAEVCNLDVRKNEQVHTGGRGAAIIAAVGQGFYPDFESAVNAMCESTTTVCR